MSAEGVNQSQEGCRRPRRHCCPHPPVSRGSACGCRGGAGFPRGLPVVALFRRRRGRPEYFSPLLWKASSPLHFLQLRPGSSSLDGPSLSPGPQLQRAPPPPSLQRIRSFALLLPGLPRRAPFPALTRPSLPVQSSDVPLWDRLLSSLHPGG